MKLKHANLEDITNTYFNMSEARLAATELIRLIDLGDSNTLNEILRNHCDRSITLQKEIKFRAAIDRLLCFYSILEIASIAGFIPDIGKASDNINANKILNNYSMRRYYESFYPTILPQLFRFRLDGSNRTTATSDIENKTILSFLALDLRFTENLEGGTLLKLLDSFTLSGRRFDDVISIIESPKEFMRYAYDTPQGKQDQILHEAITEFILFIDFSTDLKNLLNCTNDNKLLQSALWHNYSYWFGIIGKSLENQLGKAFLGFRKWTQSTNTSSEVLQIDNFVRTAKETLTDLTDNKYSATATSLLKSFM